MAGDCPSAPCPARCPEQLEVLLGPWFSPKVTTGAIMGARDDVSLD